MTPSELPHLDDCTCPACAFARRIDFDTLVQEVMQDIGGRATCPHEDAVRWNPWNKVVQCHRCGQVFVPKVN